jgi:hypothetical protein
MARLPQIGGDGGDWGTILNDFLLVSHDSTGALSTSALQNANGITTSQVGVTNGVASLNGSAHVPVTELGAGTASPSNFLRGDGRWAVPNGTVASVFSRTGSITAQGGDYTAAQITNAADKSSTNTQTFDANVSAPSVIASGLTGATAASRYVGGTTSGAPNMGTFTVGDFVIDQTAVIWICTAAGSPGTWNRVGGSAAQDPYLPSDDGLLAASWDPAANTSWGASNNTTVFLVRIPIRAAITATNLVMLSEGISSSGDSTGTFVGLYQLADNQLTLLTGSSDMGSAFATPLVESSSAVTLPFTTTQSVAAGSMLYGAVLFNMTNVPTLFQYAARLVANASTGTWQRVLVLSNTSYATLPATVSESDLSYDGWYASPLWMGLS